MFTQGLITFNPKQFSNLKLWLDASNVLNGSNPANSSLVSTWTDLSGATGNAVAVGGLRPTFSTEQQNSLPGIQFSGAQSIDVANLAIGSNVTIFTVSRSATQTMFIEQSQNINTNDGIHIAGGNGTNALNIRNGGASVITAGTNWSGTDTVLLTMTYDGTTQLGYKNGVSTLNTAGEISNDTVTNTLYIGSRGATTVFMTGYFFEIILYNSVLSAGQQSIVNDYLRRKWAIY